MWLQLLALPLHILSSHRPRLTTSLHLSGPHGAPVAAGGQWTGSSVGPPRECCHQD